MSLTFVVTQPRTFGERLSFHDTCQLTGLSVTFIRLLIELCSTYILTIDGGTFRFPISAMYIIPSDTITHDHVSYDLVYSHLRFSRLYRVYCSFINIVNIEAEWKSPLDVPHSLRYANMAFRLSSSLLWILAKPRLPFPTAALFLRISSADLI